MFSEGEKVILMDGRGRKYLVNLERRAFHTNLGALDLGELVGKEPGARIKTPKGHEFTAVKPSIVDYLQKLKRVPQIMLPKDAAMVVAHTAVGPGSLVVDAGAGSGALAIFLGNLVRPNGRVVSYEVREDFAEVARGNIEMAGLGSVVTVKQKDIYGGIDERDVDLVTLDLAQPELAVPHAERALKVGGYLAVFTPCVEHLQRLYKIFPGTGFRDIKTIECMIREMEVKSTCTRPKTLMVGHTGYLTFARRT